MTRTILLLLAGAACGGITVHVLAPPRLPALDSSEPPAEPAAGSLPGAVRAEMPAGALGDSAPGTAERLTLYRMAAEAGERELRRLIAEAAETRSPAARRFALDALLTRYAELDAAAAALFAVELELDVPLLSIVYHAWAAADRTAALRGLGAIEDAKTTRAVALALVDVVGTDETSLARLLESLPGVDPDTFRAGALAARAATAPAAALERALEVADPRAAGLAVQRVAETWAGTDPRAALAHVNAIEDEVLRSAFESAALGAWAKTEPDAMLEHIADHGTRLSERNVFGAAWMRGLAPGPLRDEALGAMLGTVASSENRADLTLLDAFSDDGARQRAVLSAVMITAQRDPAAARALVEEHITDAALRAQAEQMLTADGRRNVPSFLPAEIAVRSSGIAVPFRP